MYHDRLQDMHAPVLPTSQHASDRCRKNWPNVSVSGWPSAASPLQAQPAIAVPGEWDPAVLWAEERISAVREDVRELLELVRIEVKSDFTRFPR